MSYPTQQIERLERLLKVVADIMRRCDPEYCESHSVEQTTDEEWDKTLEQVEDAAEGK